MRSGLKSAAFLMLLFLMCLPHASSAQTSRGASVPPESLSEELRTLSPQDYFIPSARIRVGDLDRLEGTVVVVHGAGKQAYFGVQGDPVYEDDTLVTLAQSKCRIRFLGRDVVTMAADSEFVVESCKDLREEGRKSSFFKMLRGKVLVHAVRLFSYRDIQLTLVTPTDAIGVRGTRFGVHVYSLDDRKTEGTRRSATDCFCEEGVLDVSGRTVVSGQMFDGRTGQVIPTPPDVIRSFRQATEFKNEGAPGITPGAEGRSSSPPAGSVTGGLPAEILKIQEDIPSTVQTQTGGSGHVPPLSPSSPSPTSQPGSSPSSNRSHP